MQAQRGPVSTGLRLFAPLFLARAGCRTIRHFSLAILPASGQY
jgi:hypothetical protein